MSVPGLEISPLRTHQQVGLTSLLWPAHPVKQQQVAVERDHQWVVTGRGRFLPLKHTHSHELNRIAGQGTDAVFFLCESQHSTAQLAALACLLGGLQALDLPPQSLHLLLQLSIPLLCLLQPPVQILIKY